VRRRHPLAFVGKKNTARRTFSSSRTFPVHEWRMSRSSASFVRERRDRPLSFAIRASRWSTIFGRSRDASGSGERAFFVARAPCRSRSRHELRCVSQ
jgi:hypothetical protein